MVGRGLGDLYHQLSPIHIDKARIAGGRRPLLFKYFILVFGPNILINQSFYKGRTTLNSSEGKRRNNTEDGVSYGCGLIIVYKLRFFCIFINISYFI